MKEIRIGNTFVVLWRIKYHDPATEETLDYNLEGKDISLYYITHCGKRAAAHDFSVEENTVIWKFQGSSQRDLGVYTLMLIENEGSSEQRTVDISQAFRLVPDTESVNNGDDQDDIEISSVELESTANFIMLNYVISQDLGEKEDVTISQKKITEELQRRVISDGIRFINTQYTEAELKAMAEAGTLKDDVLYLAFEEP